MVKRRFPAAEPGLVISRGKRSRGRRKFAWPDGREETWPRRRYGTPGSRDTHALCIRIRALRRRRKEAKQTPC